MTAVMPTHASVHVSFREAKEESYRALRAAGYSWGVAQLAGRLAGSAQVLWGDAISTVTRDASRWGVRNRPLRSRHTGNIVAILSRGSSWLMTAPVATAIVVGSPGKVAWVRGNGGGPELATALWDMDVELTQCLMWGRVTPSGWSGFHITPDGDLHRTEVTIPPPGKPPGRGWWFVYLGDKPSGEVVLPRAERERKIYEAQQTGVRVSENHWSALHSRARKFLVPE